MRFTVFRKGLLVLSLISLVLASGAAEGCSNSVEVRESGSTSNQLSFTISPPADHYYPSDSVWAVSLPRQAENISVYDNEDDELRTHVTESDYLNNRLKFWNDERVSSYEEYTFYISYEMPRGVILYGRSAYLSQSIPSLCEGDGSTKVNYPEDWRINQTSIESYSEGSSSLKFAASTSRPVIWFESDEELTSIENYQSGIFNLSVPETYSGHVLSQLEKGNSYTPTIENEVGIETPESFEIQFLPFNSDEISEEAAGQYYGGKIEIKSTQLSKKNILMLDTLIHEIVHGYNDKMSSGTPDWWWEEGTSDYISHQVLEKEGYDTSLLKPSRERISATFENCEYRRSFIEDWSPVDENSKDVIEVERLFPCGTPEIKAGQSGSTEDSSEIEYIADKDRLGYRYSELIVSDIFANNSETVGDVYSLMREKNTTFSDSRDLTNNQINYFASRTTGKDLTGFFHERGIDAEAWSNHWEEIRDAEQKVKSMESNYGFRLFDDYKRDIRSVESSFYSGRFSETSKLDKIIEKAERRNKTASDTLKQYRDALKYVKSLENETDSVFYEEELEELNGSLELVRKKEFERAREEIRGVIEAAEQKSERISSYKKKEKKVSHRINSSEPPESFFMFGASEKLETSRKEFKAGDLDNAESMINTAEKKVEWSGIWILIFSLVVLIVVIYSTYRYPGLRERIQ